MAQIKIPKNRGDLTQYSANKSIRTRHLPEYDRDSSILKGRAEFKLN
ncbi:MAG: hypothetical protein VX588_03020 [Verrucomicrobiota bacterium]|nr:hypothetical protein [Verrucomicrobiota bacterium]